MRSISIKVYQFSELSAKAKEKAREWMREGEQQFWEPEYEPFETAAAILGIEFAQREVGKNKKTGAPIYQSHILYSGFYSQGDGASFVGTFNFKPGCAKAIRKEFGTDTKLYYIADQLTALFTKFRLLGKQPGEMQITQSGHYCHENTMSSELPDANENVTVEDEDAILELMRDFAKWIYNSLQEDYEYRLTDESLEETIEANDYEFTKDGERFQAA